MTIFITKNHFTFRTGLFILLTSISLISQAHERCDTATICQQIIDNIYITETRHVDISHENQETTSYLKMIQRNGSFPDLDYNSHAQTFWQTDKHLIRMKSMVFSYIIPASSYHNDKKLYDTLVQMLSFWYESNPYSTNWYNTDINCPQRLGLILSLLRKGEKKIPAQLENKILNRIKKTTKRPDHPGSPGKGANKMEIALQWFYRSCLQENSQDLNFAISQFFQPLKISLKEGIQSDYSYHQHGPQLYTGGYGASVLSAYLKIASYLNNTPFERPEINTLVSNFIRYGYMPAVRGENMLYNSIGRGFTRKNGGSQQAFANQLKQMHLLDSAFRQTYREGIERIVGNKDASYGLKALHRYYWRSEYTIHQRKTYTIDVRLASKRLYRCENGNGENLKGYFLTDGGSAITRDGNEYKNIFPVWDWSHIPGTTTPELKEIPLPRQWGTTGESDFSGGVSNNIYGITSYQYINNEYDIKTSAHKSWFFFDKEIVCMGSNINSSNSYPIHTTINQCLSKGNIKIKDSSSEYVIPNESNLTSGKICWVNHDSISYYFPQGGLISVSERLQSGTWNSISSNNPDKEIIKKKVFNLWINHGIKPENEQYLYYIVPDTDSFEDTNQAIDELTTVNTDSIQAVFNRSLNILSVVFHQPSSLQIEKMRIDVDSPCILMLTDIESKNIKGYIADPTNSISIINLQLKVPQIDRELQYKCHLITDSHFKGATHSFSLQ